MIIKSRYAEIIKDCQQTAKVSPIVVNVLEGMTEVPCPNCGKVWTADCYPKLQHYEDPRLIPMGPYCPSCGVNVTIMLIKR